MVALKISFHSLIKNNFNVALFNSSSPVAPEHIENNLEFIKKFQKFNILENKSDIIPVNCFNEYLARPPELNANRFTELFLDDEIDIIWCARGGYGILKWLKYIEWKKINNKEKTPLIVGFSDVTFLHSCLSNFNKISLHAPLFTTLVKSSPDTLESLFNTLDGKPQALRGKIFKEGASIGKLTGGNLTCLINSIGTPYEPRFDGSILLLEDHNEASYRIDRMLTQLLLSGRLEKVKGICFGEFFFNGGKIDLEKILTITINELNVPVLFDLPVGHGKDNFALFMGTNYKIDGFKGILEIC